MDDMAQIGAAGLLVLIILREVFAFLKTRNGVTKSQHLDKMSKQLDELHQWHNVVDDDGVKVWYVRRSLEQAIVRFAGAVEKQTIVLERMMDRLERIEGRLDDK